MGRLFAVIPDMVDLYDKFNSASGHFELGTLLDNMSESCQLKYIRGFLRRRQGGKEQRGAQRVSLPQLMGG